MKNEITSRDIRAAIMAALLFIIPIMAYAENKTDSNSPSSSFEKPDFAFPEKVNKDAMRHFSAALANGNGIETLKAAIQVVVARNLISKSSFRDNVAMLDSAAKILPEPYSQLSYALEATLYRQLYEADAWKYNQRTLPVAEMPDDPLSWSRDQFCRKILSLSELALQHDTVAKGMPLTDISTIISDAENISKYNLSVYDFLIYSCVGNLNAVGSGMSDRLIPFNTSAKILPLTLPGQCEDKAEQLIDGLIEYCEASGNAAALSVAISIKADNLDFSKRKSFLDKWKDRLINTPWDARILNAYYEAEYGGEISGSDSQKSFYRQLKSWLNNFPEAVNADLVKYDIECMASPSMRIEVAEALLPYTEGQGKIRLVNLKEGYVLIYKVPESLVTVNSVNLGKFPSGCEKVAVVKIEAGKAGEVPFVNEEIFQIPRLNPGRYVLIPSGQQTLASDWRKKTELWSVGSLNVTDLSIISMSNPTEEKSGFIYVVNSGDQHPIAGAEVSVYDNNKIIKKGKTGTDGSFLMPEGYYRVKVRYGKSSAEGWSGYSHNTIPAGSKAFANILTDLSIYRPGSKMQFAVVGMSKSDGINCLLKNESVTVYLRDANYNLKDSVSLTTDNSGRCSGEFAVPSTGMLGRHILQVKFGSYPSYIAGSTSVEVAEYKTPGFYVELNADSSRTYKAGDLLKFKGTVKTYSGMPLDNAKVSFKVKWNPWWRYWTGSNSNASFGGEALTDSNGNFVITLQTDSLKNTEFEFGTYLLSVSATSLSGETQEARDLRFSLGTDFNIRPDVPQNICADGKDIAFHIPVYDMLGLPVKEKVEYAMKDLSCGKVVSSGNFISPALVLSAEEIPSGKYQLTLNVEGDTLKTKIETVVWRESDKKTPFDTPLWVPKCDIVAETGATVVEIPVGSAYAGSWLLYVVTGRNGILQREWIETDDSISSVSVKAPDGNERIQVTFCGMHDFDARQQTVSIISEKSTERLAVKTVTFRDKATAGGKEHWKFSFSVNGVSAGKIPVLAVMSDKSLNALAPFSWDFNVPGNYFYNATNVRIPSYRTINTIARMSPILRLPHVADPVPVFYTYGYNLGNIGMNRFMLKAASRSIPSGGMICGADDSVVKEESADGAVTAMSAPVYANMAVADAATEESQEASDNVGARAEDIDTAELRPIEMPLAFFRTDLDSDPNGEVTIDFDMPDFNTTWQFQIIGYTENLLSARLIKDVVASKQVMVKSNPPRYLRAGDKSYISALLFNNSDKEIALGGELVVFDPLSGNVLASARLEEGNTSPSGSRVVSIEWVVPSDMNAVGIRAYAYGDSHTDGEQTVVPIYPSSTPVLESTQFFMGTGEKTFTKKLPKYGKNANVTFKYCYNPLWEVVTALPSISSPDSKNILVLMKSLFANSMAIDIAVRYPEVRSAIEKVISFKEESFQNVLKSNLEKDAGLKTVELVNTPWVNNASSETLRMQSVVKLLEPGAGQEIAADLMEKIAGMQSRDGGWGWCPDMKSSPFITRKVLLYFGMMRKAGILQDKGKDMIGKAISYCDKSAYDDYLKSDEKYSVRDMLDYLYIRSFFDAGKTVAGFPELKRKALDSISREWQKFSIYEKSMAAMLLFRSKGYESYAHTILESLSQYASKDDAHGWWFDNLSSGNNGWSKISTTAAVLEAYSEIEPDSPAVDGLRQWLLLQKSTEDLGADSDTVEVIRAIVACGTQWISPEAAPLVTVGENQLGIPEGESLPGILTLQLEPEFASGKQLEIRKTSSSPAWGGVVSQYLAPIKDVKAEKCENLKIDKKLLVVNESSQGTVVSESPLKVGDKVRVTLTLTCRKDMNYVAVTDSRSACLEPADQVSAYTVKDGLGMYREVRDTGTSFFIDFLPKGIYVLTYDCYVDREGEYANGVATVQSQYSPLDIAHSAGAIINVTAK